MESVVCEPLCLGGDGEGYCCVLGLPVAQTVEGSQLDLQIKNLKITFPEAVCIRAETEVANGTDAPPNGLKQNRERNLGHENKHNPLCYIE
ncbi:hypothetical protein SKAU_G00315490 [Synaphobranchus kaupii]|uniref:Uncharacterized protein n=1 Tax=Synaphobranchus kaupii TaxID=118154 RepID=A0A9Q1ESH3_SYNKA|nr:hypothetical protein SKAU_G00315490 [Synaphobranchus kaupii]